ncbi:restriction endonuclease subunit S [Vibrio parahaemolyticus]|uniref:restriction endonuclease subunit S n=1 Tax=Vibrio parahaemolyticus TaxID=670 RepID=UPI003891EE31
MSCNWPLVKLADVACIITTKIDANQITKDCYISTENMQPYKGGVSSADSLPSAAKFNSFRVGDTLFSNIRTYFEKVWLASFSGGASADVLIFRTKDESVLLSEYLYHFLSSPEFIEFTVRTSKGAKMPRGDKGAMMDFEFKLPPVEIQKIIACSLQGLERKVRLNSQTNQTLEQMAQAIFKSWFVDFEPVKAKMNGEQPEGMDAATASLFPEKLVESELGFIPDGWNIESIKDFGDVICGKTPSKKNADFYGGDVPFIKIPDTHGKVFITETSDTLTQVGDESQPKKRIPENSICVSCIATVGQVFITTKPSHTNQQINSVVPYDQNSLYYLLFKFKALNKHFHDLASGGSATLNMNTSTFSKVALVRPTADVLEAFHKTVGGLMEKMLANQLENATLSELRDTLLPKLLSGEIELGTSEELVEAI